MTIILHEKIEFYFCLTGCSFLNLPKCIFCLFINSTYIQSLFQFNLSTFIGFLFNYIYAYIIYIYIYMYNWLGYIGWVDIIYYNIDCQFYNYYIDQLLIYFIGTNYTFYNVNISIFIILYHTMHIFVLILVQMYS